MDDRPSRVMLPIGIGLVICGWAVILLGWYQTGRQDLETGQIPYIIAAGFGGFGLLLVGAVAILIDVVRQSEWKLRRSAEELHARMEQLAESFSLGDAEARSRDDRPPRRPRRRRRSGPAARTGEHAG
jgi:hypothetical protein